MEVPGTTYGDDWYDYKIYNETVLIPAKQRAAKAAKWEKEEAIRAKQRAENLQKYTQKYGEKMAKAIVDGRVIPGMTVDMITEEMGLSYQMLNSSTIIVGSAIGGVMVFEMYKCAVTNGKITMVENIFMKDDTMTGIDYVSLCGTNGNVICYMEDNKISSCNFGSEAFTDPVEFNETLISMNRQVAEKLGLEPAELKFLGYDGNEEADELKKVFEGSGTVRIDYIGFYKAQNSLVDTSRIAGQSPAQNITRGGKNYTLVSTLFGEGNNDIPLTDYLGAGYIEEGTLLKITQQDTSTEETMDLPANGANVSYIELRVKLSSTSASPHLGLTWQAQFFRNNLGGSDGGGLACGINGHQVAINPTSGVYSLYGIALSETAGDELVFFFDGVEKASGIVNEDLRASVVKGQETYPFFYTFDGGSGAWFEIDYIAFYTDVQ